MYRSCGCDFMKYAYDNSFICLFVLALSNEGTN